MGLELLTNDIMFEFGQLAKGPNGQIKSDSTAGWKRQTRAVDAIGVKYGSDVKQALNQYLGRR